MYRHISDMFRYDSYHHHHVAEKKGSAVLTTVCTFCLSELSDVCGWVVIVMLSHNISVDSIPLF
jgi:hypothetical protein